MDVRLSFLTIKGVSRLFKYSMTSPNDMSAYGKCHIASLSAEADRYLLTIPVHPSFRFGKYVDAELSILVGSVVLMH